MCSSGEQCNFVYSVHVCTMCHLGTVTPQNLKLCLISVTPCLVDCVWNVMAHAQKPDFVFRQNGLAGEVCASAVVMLDTPCSEVVWRVLATHSIHQFPLLCVITFQLDSSTGHGAQYHILRAFVCDLLLGCSVVTMMLRYLLGPSAESRICVCQTE
jgi:hypothetical protein